MDALKKILFSHIKKNNSRHKLKLALIFSFWDEIITEICGEKYKNASKPAYLKNSILKVDCLNAVWANEFQLYEDKIRKAINQKLNKGEIKKIKFIY